MNLIRLFLLLFKRRSKIDAEKKFIIHEVKNQQRDLTLDEMEFAANTVFSKIENLPQFINAKTVMIYWSLPEELPSQRFIDKWKNEKKIFLPTMSDDKLVAKHYSADAIMMQRTLGVWQPVLTRTYRGKIDVSIVPGVAFDMNKNRLSRGKGYYDIFFSKNRTFKIGVGFDFQLVRSIPIGWVNVQLDMIITPSTTLK